MENFFKHIAIVAVLAVFSATPTIAEAACYADYKAKRNTGSLQLHYGVMKIGGGSCGKSGKAHKTVQKRLAKDGWTLLTILSTFDETGLSRRRANAGAFFLRY